MAKTKTTVTEETERVIHEDSPQTKIAVLNNDIGHINDTLSRIETKFDIAIKSFVTFDKLADAQKAADEKHQAMEEAAHEKHQETDKSLERLENWNTWAVRIVLGGVISLIIYLIVANVHLVK